MNFDNMKIYSRTGQEIIDIAHSSADYQEVQLMEKDEVSIRFSSDSILDIVPGCYVLIEKKNNYGKEKQRFIINEPVYPSYNDTTGGYDYTLLFINEYLRIKNDYMSYDRAQIGIDPVSKEPIYLHELTFSLTGTLEQHLDIWLGNVIRLYKPYSEGLVTRNYSVNFKDVPNRNEIKYINYDNITLFDAINMICEKYGCEWWCTGAVFNFGICQTNNKFTFKHHVAFNSLTVNRTEEKYYNRVYVYGSDRNIPPNYRAGRDGQAMANIQKRLCLPTDKTPMGYIDIDADVDNGQYQIDNPHVVALDKTYDEIFPEHLSQVGIVLTGQGSEKNETTGITKYFTTYLVNDINELGITNDDIKDGEKLYITFQDGDLAGLEFEVKFHQDYSYGGTTYSCIYEVVRSNEYGVFLPNDTLRPKVGDKFILSNFDFRMLERTYIKTLSGDYVEFELGEEQPDSQQSYASFRITEETWNFLRNLDQQTYNTAIVFTDTTDSNNEGKFFNVVVIYHEGYEFQGVTYPEWYGIFIYRDERYGSSQPQNLRQGDKFWMFQYDKNMHIDGSLFTKYVFDAEARLLERAVEDVKFLNKYGNIRSFTLNMNPVYVNGYAPKQNNLLKMTDGILLTSDGKMVNMRAYYEDEWTKQHDVIYLELGDSVSVYSEIIKDACFPTRVLGFKKMLDGSGNDDCTCGINRRINVLKNIENRLNKLEYGK